MPRLYVKDDGATDSFNLFQLVLIYGEFFAWNSLVPTNYALGTATQARRHGLYYYEIVLLYYLSTISRNSSTVATTTTNPLGPMTCVDVFIFIGPLSTQSSIELEKQLWVINVCVCVYTYCEHNNNNKKGARCSTHAHIEDRAIHNERAQLTISPNWQHTHIHTYIHVQIYACLFHIHSYFYLPPSCHVFFLRCLPLRSSIMKAQCLCVCGECREQQRNVTRYSPHPHPLSISTLGGSSLALLNVSRGTTHILLHTHTQTHTLLFVRRALAESSSLLSLSLILSIGGMQMRRMQYAKSECRWSAGLCQLPLPSSSPTPSSPSTNFLSAALLCLPFGNCDAFALL